MLTTQIPTKSYKFTKNIDNLKDDCGPNTKKGNHFFSDCLFLVAGEGLEPPASGL